MSFHLPHRRLPQELRAIIYQYALCPPEGLTIQPSVDQEVLEKAPESRLRCQPAIASGLLCTNRQVYDATLPVLYKGNILAMKTRCWNALRLLQSLPKQTRLLIKCIHLPKELMAPDEIQNREYTEQLCRFLIDDMRLETVSLAVPDDLLRVKYSSDYRHPSYPERFEWTLTMHEIMIKAFHEGHFHGLRFVHPKFYYENFDPLSGTRTTRIERKLMGEHQLSVDLRRDRYWEAYYAAQRNRTVCQDTRDALREFETDVRRRAGFIYEPEAHRLDGIVTVMVFRRIAPTLKRGCDEVGFSPKRKRRTEFGKEEEAGGEEPEATQ